MRALVRWMMAAAVIAAMAVPALAQRPGGGGGGAMMGFGGGGGMNVKSLLATNTALQEELKVTDEQVKALKEFADEQQKEMAKFGFGGGDEEEQLARAKANVKAMEDRIAFYKKTLTPTQTKRIGQIEKQVLGMAAFSNAKIAAELKMTDDQKAKVKELNEELQKETRELFGRGGGGGAFDPEAMQEMQKKMKALRDEAMEKLEKGLSDDQKKTWKEMVGAPFDTAKLMQRPMRRDN